MANHGTDPRRRMAVMAERVAAMKAIWTQEEASYAGEHVAFERIWCWPKPAQHPHPPVLVGGNGPTVLDRVLAFGDAWLPNHAREAVHERIPELRARAEEAGRSIPVQVIGVPADAGVLARYEEAGVARCVFWVPSAARSVVEAAMERFEAAIAELHGE
jgi:alkanesulfonate monooxygenase SsuD/methylene tetrahydromethanopterin reductase-like flavin-dependent oxidoreductase (luciferase family)